MSRIAPWRHCSVGLLLVEILCGGCQEGRFAPHPESRPGGPPKSGEVVEPVPPPTVSGSEAEVPFTITEPTIIQEPLAPAEGVAPSGLAVDETATSITPEAPVEYKLLIPLDWFQVPGSEIEAVPGENKLILKIPVEAIEEGTKPESRLLRLPFLISPAHAQTSMPPASPTLRVEVICNRPCEVVGGALLFTMKAGEVNQETPLFTIAALKNSIAVAVDRVILDPTRPEKVLITPTFLLIAAPVVAPLPLPAIPSGTTPAPIAPPLPPSATTAPAPTAAPVAPLPPQTIHDKEEFQRLTFIEPLQKLAELKKSALLPAGTSWTDLTPAQETILLDQRLGEKIGGVPPGMGITGLPATGTTGLPATGATGLPVVTPPVGATAALPATPPVGMGPLGGTGAPLPPVVIEPPATLPPTAIPPLIESTPELGRAETEELWRVQKKEKSKRDRVILNCFSREEVLVRTNPHVKRFFEQACSENRQLIAVYDFERAILTTLAGTLTDPSKADHQKLIFQFLTSHQGLFGVSNPEEQLQFIPERSHLETPQKAYKFVQVLGEIPVYGGSVSVTIDEQGRIRSLANNFKPSIYQKSFPSQVNLQPKEVKEIVTKDLKMAPIDKVKKGDGNTSLEEKMKRIKPALVWAPDKGGWRLVYRHLMAVWEKDLEAKGDPKKMRPAAYEYWIDAENGRLLLKRDAGYYCDNSVGLVETPVSQFTWDDRGRVPFNTCEGWKWKITKKGMRRITYYLEDHTHSGVIETYDISEVSLSLLGYNTSWLPGGWPSSTPTDENDIWEDHGASDVATVHWAAQKFRDFLKEEFSRDQIHGDNDIDVGAHSPSRSRTFPWIETATVELRRSGLSSTVHELMHIVSYYENPGAGVFSFRWDDDSVNEYISDLFAVFTQFRKSPYRSLRERAWCHGLDDATTVAGSSGEFNLLLADRGLDQAPEARAIFQAFRQGQPFRYSDSRNRYCGGGAGSANPFCWHKSHEGQSESCRFGDKYRNYDREGPMMRAGLLLTEGGHLYRDMEVDRSGRPSRTQVGAEPNAETDFDAQVIVQPIGMERLMQISYKTVIGKIDSGMHYEDWAARQLASCHELGYGNENCCQVKNAYSAVGYGESDDFDCDGTPNATDPSPWGRLFSDREEDYTAIDTLSHDTQEEIYQIRTNLLTGPEDSIGGLRIQDALFQFHLQEGDTGNIVTCQLIRTPETDRQVVCEVSQQDVEPNTEWQIYFADQQGNVVQTSPTFRGEKIIEWSRNRNLSGPTDPR